MKRVILAAALLISLTGLAPGAAAQSGIGTQRLTPPTMNPPKDAESELGAMATGLLLIILVIGANAIPSKRGHKD